MQQITIHINNPKIEALLSDISQKDNISVDAIISKLIEEYIYLYPVRTLNEQEKNHNDIFIEFMDENTISLQNDNLTRAWIHNNNISDDLYR